MADMLPLDVLLRDYRDGDGHGWQAEFDWLDMHHAARMDMLTTSIQEVGIREPILLGNDGRVWDGHHRIAAAHRLGLVSVPVEVVRADCDQCKGRFWCPACADRRDAGRVSTLPGQSTSGGVA